MRSALYSGSVIHRRIRPRRHRLRYRVFWLLLDLDEIEAVTSRVRPLSRNRFNLLSFHDKDHGDGSATPLKQQAYRLLQQAGLPVDGRITLLCMPRILGYGFNPISLYFCHDAGERLRAIIYQVHNTFGERHSYVLPCEADDGGAILQSCRKTFHVSPFLPMEMRYAFRFNDAGDRLSLTIEGSDDDGPLVVAALAARRETLASFNLMRAFALHPLMTIKVIAAIHWHAARMLAKRFAWHNWTPKKASADGEEYRAHAATRFPEPESSMALEERMSGLSRRR